MVDMVDDLDYLHIEWHLGRVRREQLLKHKSFDFQLCQRALTYYIYNKKGIPC